MSQKEGFSQAKHPWKGEAIGLLWGDLQKRSPLEPMGGDSQLMLSMCRWPQVTRDLGFGRSPRPSHFITPHHCILNLFIPSNDWMGGEMRWDAMRWCERQGRALKWLAQSLAHRKPSPFSALWRRCGDPQVCCWDACSVPTLCLWREAVRVCRLLLTCWHEWRREAEVWFQSLHFSRSHNPLQV